MSPPTRREPLHRTTTPHFRLLDLPAEIRETIFEFALASDKPVVTFRLHDYQRETYQEAVQPALTRVSQQLRQESLQLFYQVNRFILHTEDPKAHESHKWAKSNERWLSKVLRFSLFVRHVTLTNEQNTSNGAICISLERAKIDREWRVEDAWQWITVTRKPASINGDVKFLIVHGRLHAGYSVIALYEDQLSFHCLALRLADGRAFIRSHKRRYLPPPNKSISSHQIMSYQTVISTTCTGLASLAFIFGAQARLTAKFSPEFHEEQKAKTAESQAIIYKTLRISPAAANVLTGIINLVLVVGLWPRNTRRPTAALALLYLCLGVRGRWISGRSVKPPLVIMLLLVGAML